MPIIAVVTPLFPLPDEPYRGQPIYESVRALQKYADVRVFCPITAYPSWSAFVRPRLPTRHDLSYSPPDVAATCFSYPALPLVNRPWNGEICARRLYPFLEKLRPDLVLNYWVYPEGYAGVKVARSLGIPSIVFSRGSDLQRIEDPLTRYRVRTTLRKANYVLTVSQDLRRRAIDLGAGPERTAAILNGCDPATFRLRDRAAARLSLRLPPDEEVLLYVGRLAKSKGVLDLLQAFAALAEESSNVRLALVGSGPLEARVRQFVEVRGWRDRISLAGERAPAEVAEWMAAASLFCLPSYSEGCPNVLIEASRCGCPAVAASVGGVPELLRPESGILVPAGNAAALTEALRAGLSKTWDRAAIAQTLPRTWDDVARETYAVCRQVLDQSSRSSARPSTGRMKITVVTPYFPTSEGSYRGHSAFQTLRILKRWADIHVVCPLTRYPKIKWLTPRNYDSPDLTYQPRELDATYFQYPAIPVITRPVNGLICEQYLLPHVRATHPDLILNYWLYPEGFSAVRVGRTLGVPVIVGAIGSDVRRISDAYIRHLVRRTLLESSGVITVSEELRQRTIALGVPPGHVTTILNGCDGAIFRPGDRDEARRKLGLDLSIGLIVFVGTLLPTKGLAELMEAFIGMVPSRPNLRLALIGEGVFGETLKARAAQAGVLERVLMPGRQESAAVAAWMRAGDLFCLPSYSEGCPNVVVEALSCGRPIVATDVGGIPELVRESCGMLVPPRDPDRLQAALDAALSRAWDTERIAATFQRDWEKVAEETFTVCRRVLDAARAVS